MRRRVSGEEVRADDVERLPPDGGPTTFVRLCSALIGRALVEKSGHFALPQVSERITVPDGGVDAEYVLPATATAGASELTGSGRTVVQIKYRDIVAAPRPAQVRRLARALREELSRRVPECDRYVLMTNLHLAGAQPRNLRKLLDSFPALAGKPNVIWGASEIALHLNCSPHLRHLFFSTGGLCTLDFAEEELKAAYASIGWPSFIDREHECTAIATFVRDPPARVMQLIGPRYAGKTRLTIEALRPWGARVIWAARPEDVSVDIVRDLDASDEQTLLVVDGCDAGSARSILETAGARRTLKTLVLREGAPVATGAGVVPLAPLGDGAMTKLVSEVLPRAPFMQQSWLREATGGLPGLVLHVAALLEEARLSPSFPPAEVHRRIGALLEEQYLRSVDADSRRALSVVALLLALGVDGEAGAEADSVSRALGLSPEEFRSRLPELEGRGLLRRRGRFLEVVPPRLADHLASHALGRPEPVLAELLLGLPESALLRLLERFRNLATPEVRSTIAGVIAKWFPDVEALVGSAKRLEIFAPAAPSHVLACLERLLLPLPPDVLENRIAGDARRSVVRTLEDLALRSATFARAARLLLSLAEAENETWGNNAAGVFVRLFNWQHPEVSAPFSRRLDVLENEAAAPSVTRLALVARAAGYAFDERSYVILHHAKGADLPEPPYRAQTLDEVREYGLGVFRVIARLLEHPDADIRGAAAQALLDSLEPFVRYSLEPDGFHDLGREALEVVAKVGRSTPTARSRSRLVSVLEMLAAKLAENMSPSAGVTEVVGATNNLLRDLTAGSFRDRLWRWTGPRSWKLDIQLLDDPAAIEREITTIARSLIECPALFEQHLDWLLGEDAEERAQVFQTLGKEDRGTRLLETLLSRSDSQRWPSVFGSYVSGWFMADPERVNRTLDELSESRPDLSRGLLAATSSIPPSAIGVDRIVRLLRRGTIPGMEVVPEVLPAFHWDSLGDEDALRLIDALDDHAPEVRAALLWPLLLRLNRGGLTPELRERAWAYLGATVVESSARQGHVWEFLASKLGESEPERVLDLVEDLARADAAAGEGASAPRELHMVWKTLTARHRPALVGRLLRLALRANAPFWVQRQLERTLEPAGDRGLLVSFATEGGVAAARLVADLLDAEAAGFWEIARDLLIAWGDDQVVSSRLVGRLGSGSWQGSAVPMVTRRLEAARRLLDHPHPRVAAWAQQAVDFLEDWRRSAEREDHEEWVWDYDVSRRDFEAMIRGKASPERLWAVGRLLKDAPPERVRELLSPDDILEALPKLTDLDEGTRRKWSAYARYLSERTEDS